MEATIRNSLLRLGNVTSSEIVALMSNDRTGKAPGKPFYTYLEECNYERLLDRPVENEMTSRPTSWGNLVEGHVFDRLGLEYQLVSKDTRVHPDYPFWAGTPDAIKEDKGRTVVSIKAPLTPLSFCRLAEPVRLGYMGMDAMNWIRDNHKDGEKFYWQNVSDACIVDAQFAELVPYMPYKKDLQAIREKAENASVEDLFKYRWINSAQDDELPWIHEGGKYKDLNVIRFEVPIEDKQALIDRVRMAGKLLDLTF